MKKININIIVIISVILSGISFAQDSTQFKKGKGIKKHPKSNYKHFVDADGDGYNDNAPDHDGDGIPNGIDPDYIKLNKRKNSKSLDYIDSNGDGINDNLQFNGKRRMRGFNYNGFNKQVTPQNSSNNNNIEHGNKKKGKGRG